MIADIAALLFVTDPDAATQVQMTGSEASAPVWSSSPQSTSARSGWPDAGGSL